MSVLSSREWATVFWLAVFVGWVLTQQSVRHSVSGVLRAMLAWKLLLTFAVVAAWLTVLVLVSRSLGLWNAGLRKDTILWFLVSGVTLGFAALRATKEDAFFKQELKRMLGIAVFVQFLLNVYTFNFFLEVPLQALLALLVAVSVYAGYHKEHAPAKRLVDGLLAMIGAVLLIATLRGIIRTWQSIDVAQKLLEFAFSIWVPLLMLPLIYGIALVMVYELCFMRIGMRGGSGMKLGEKVRVIWATRCNLTTARRLCRHPASLNALGQASTRAARKRVLTDLLSVTDAATGV